MKNVSVCHRHTAAGLEFAIGILAVLLLASAKERAKRTLCLKNLLQINIALLMYADSKAKKLPQMTAGN